MFTYTGIIEANGCLADAGLHYRLHYINESEASYEPLGCCACEGTEDAFEALVRNHFYREHMHVKVDAAAWRLRDLSAGYEFRSVRANEAADAVRIEEASFPVSEACTLPIMETRVAAAPDLFYVAIERATGEMVGFTTSIATGEEHLRDEFFTDSAGNHEPDGPYVMVLSLAVHPDHRRQGIASALMAEMLKSQQTAGRKAAVLTCVPAKVAMYEKMGYRDLGMSDSSWGGEAWHEMICPLQ